MEQCFAKNTTSTLLEHYIITATRWHGRAVWCVGSPVSPSPPAVEQIQCCPVWWSAVLCPCPPLRFVRLSPVALLRHPLPSSLARLARAICRLFIRWRPSVRHCMDRAPNRAKVGHLLSIDYNEVHNPVLFFIFQSGVHSTVSFGCATMGIP